MHYVHPDKRQDGRKIREYLRISAEAGAEADTEPEETVFTNKCPSSDPNVSILDIILCILKVHYDVSQPRVPKFLRVLGASCITATPYVSYA